MNALTYNRHVAMVFLACACLILLPFPAYAQWCTNSQGGAMTYSICYVVAIIQGDMGTAMAILGICAVSAAAVLGKASWGMALTVSAGISILFGASSIASGLGIGSICVSDINNPC